MPGGQRTFRNSLSNSPYPLGRARGCGRYNLLARRRAKNNKSPCSTRAAEQRRCGELHIATLARFVVYCSCEQIMLDAPPGAAQRARGRGRRDGRKRKVEAEEVAERIRVAPRSAQGCRWRRWTSRRQWKSRLDDETTRRVGIRIECSAVYTLRCLFMARITNRENKRFVSHGFCRCARPYGKALPLQPRFSDILLECGCLLVTATRPVARRGSCDVGAGWDLLIWCLPRSLGDIRVSRSGSGLPRARSARAFTG